MESAGRIKMTAQYERILYQVTNHIATVTINRPQVFNAFDYQTLREMSDAFRTAADDDQVGVVVLTGAGERAFCTGADLNEQQQFLKRPHDYFKWFGAFQDAHDQLRWIGKPTIARLNGIVVGGGNEFNLACDLAIAAEHVTIRQIGNSRGSVAAGGATQWLPLFVGERRAREILWLNEEITAPQALAWGLVNQVVPWSELDAAVNAMAQKLLRKMPDVMRYTKTQTNFWKEFAWSQTVMHARDWLALHAASAEVQEGLEAFREKRPVNYDALRQAKMDGGSPDLPWGSYTRTCAHCGAAHLPSAMKFCGNCGAAL
jgi:enoyl-CoA hydratase/carnithine racemase